MADPLRHRQTKGAATEMVDLTPPRHIPTIPYAEIQTEVILLSRYDRSDARRSTRTRRAYAHAIGTRVTPTTSGALHQSIVLRSKGSRGEWQVLNSWRISAQFLAPSQVEHGCSERGLASARRPRLAARRHCDEFACARRGNAPVALADGKSVGDFQIPWGAARRGGRIGDGAAHRRPSSLKSLIICRELGGFTGTSRAIGVS